MTGAFQQERRAQAHPVRIILLRDFVFSSACGFWVAFKLRRRSVAHATAGQHTRSWLITKTRSVQQQHSDVALRCLRVTQGPAFLGRGAPADGEVRLYAGGRGRALELFVADASVRPEGAGDGAGVR
jgi:hypothetical protein